MSSLKPAEGVNNVEAIAGPSPRIHGMSIGPANLAATRRMETMRTGGAHPAPGRPSHPNEGEQRRFSRQDLVHHTMGRMVDACAEYDLKPFYAPFGDFSDPQGCEAQLRSAFLQGCAGAWSLHPDQIEIAKRAFSPAAYEVAFAKRILDSMPDGSGAVMVDGEMHDDTTGSRPRIASISRGSWRPRIRTWLRFTGYEPLPAPGRLQEGRLMEKIRTARYQLGQVVRHRFLSVSWRDLRYRSGIRQ